MDLNLSAPNSQSFDDVLQKLKQSMRAARSGGWIDSDSGSELEIALDHSPNSNDEGHPCRRDSVTRSANQQLLYIKDGMDQGRGDVEDESHPNLTLASTPLWANSHTNPRASDFYHLKTRPLTTSSLKYHSVDPISVSYPQDSRISPPFDTPASPYAPRTPSTVSIGTSAGSPYVRHHFKWEYLPSSTTREGYPPAATQPRFVESSSPPLKPDHDEPCSDWSRGFLPREFIFPSESAQPQPSDARYNFENQTPSINSNVPSNMGNSYRSVSYSPTHGKSQSVPPHNLGAGYNRFSGLENINKNANSLKSGPLEPPQKSWLLGAPPQELKSHSQSMLNPAYVSSVSFSLAPVAPIRLSAPEGASPLKGSGQGISRSSSREINPLSHMAQSRTPITPIGYGLNTLAQAPYPPTPPVNKSPLVPVIVPAVPGISGAVGAPLPGQVQPEEVRKSVKTQPPVVNTGNSGAMIPQPGDWMCICGFVNWRRRKVCMRCFPFADGNDSVGAMMALNAQRAALLAAGIPLTKEHSNSTSVISNYSPSLFQSSETPSYPEMGKQIADQKANLNRVFSSPGPMFNYGRLVEPTSLFTSPAQGMNMNPFDKPSPLDPISPIHCNTYHWFPHSTSDGNNFHHSSNGETNDRYYNGLSGKPLVRDVRVSCPIGRGEKSPIRRPEKSPKVLRARLVAPGEDHQTERSDWEESTSKSPRPRSFSMGAKSVWDSNEEIRQTRVLEATTKSNKREHDPIGKKKSGILGPDEVVGSQAVSSRLVPGRLQELNTISNSGTNVYPQRTITSPDSSWQAIKVLWQ